MNAHAHTHARTCKHACTHARTQALMHARTHTHTVVWTCQPRPKQVDACPFGVGFEKLCEFNLRFGRDSAKG